MSAASSDPVMYGAEASRSSQLIIRCLDIETTGLDPIKDGIVEIAAVDLKLRRKFAARYWLNQIGG